MGWPSTPGTVNTRHSREEGPEKLPMDARDEARLGEALSGLSAEVFERSGKISIPPRMLHAPTCLRSIARKTIGGHTNARRVRLESLPASFAPHYT